MKLLIVDDDKKRQDSLAEYIYSKNENGDVDITKASSFDEAKSLLRDIYFDVVVLDVVLPKRQGDIKSTAENGLNLLDQVHRARLLKKPEKIIGITAHLSDLTSFRSNFERKCSVVIEATAYSDEWKALIWEQLCYMNLSKVARVVEDGSVRVMTVHGIQTFGMWQDRLKRLICEHTDAVSFHNYKYGYFSLLAFVVPFLRGFQVKRLVKRLTEFCRTNESSHLVIVAHSFGTYLIANAVRGIGISGLNSQKVTIVLCGSVLSVNHDWSFLMSAENVRLINECGEHDFILSMSNSFVLGTGMAGKLGFYGFSGRRMINRFFKGGHSLYFKNDDFMKRYWVDIILKDWDRVQDVDERTPGFLVHGVADQIARVVGIVKPVLYALLFFAVIRMI